MTNNFKNLLKKRIEKRLQNSVGSQWLVSNMTNRSVTFAFLNGIDSSRCRRECYAGLFVEVMLMGETFSSRVDTPREPFFPLEGGIRSQFYIDLGHLLADHDLMQYVKEALRELSRKSIVAAKESLEPASH